jgi:hypothetical protein
MHQESAFQNAAGTSGRFSHYGAFELTFRNGGLLPTPGRVIGTGMDNGNIMNTTSTV